MELSRSCCGVAVDEPCIGWYIKSDGTPAFDFLEGKPCPKGPWGNKMLNDEEILANE